ncbi:siderophore ABC transporter substrate-binding protein [Priestia abyssalis]|uniref:siderophore ABC transporter substrate-binding protein n=1 Tax=Priestia abyssalis TaxID=1221450 RepID=UPI000995B1B2|nr:siderophore ABC transporter substrate-binding protein [Priestia abyssalis]
MRKKLSLLLLTLVLAIVAAACGTQSTTSSTEKEETAQSSNEQTASTEEKELTIKHQLGETVVPKNPEKVVVFDFGTLDSLDKLGVEVTGVPQANIPSYLSKYEDSKYENVGGLKEPDFEKISEIAPDLIIISGRQQDSYEEFTKIAPTIFMGVDTANYMESYKKNATTLGEIFGKEDAVKEELTKVEEAAQQLNETASASGKNALIILANEGNISAYGAGSRFGIIHDVFGFAPADKNIEVSTHGQNVSFEYIAEKNPDYLFVIDRGTAVAEGESSAKQLVENELVKNTKAYKDGNIVYLDPNFWYLSGGGLVSVAEMVKEVEEGTK